jgi:hypothetical protein
MSAFGQTGNLMLNPRVTGWTFGGHRMPLGKFGHFDYLVLHLGHDYALGASLGARLIAL